MATFCPGSESICVVRGDSPVIPVEFFDENNTVIDITGWTGVMTVDSSPSPSSSSTNIFQVTGVVAVGTDGVMTFQPSETQLNLTPKTYFYDIQVQTTVPSKRTPLKGEFQVVQDINKG